MKDTPFKNECNNTDELKEAASLMAQRSVLHGQELEKWIKRDIKGVIGGFKGYDMYRPDKPTQIPLQQKQYILHNDALLKSDLVVFGNSNTPPVCVIESKGSIRENWYNLMWFAERYMERDIPYVVITKDTKQVFKTGNSDYLKLAKGLNNMKVFINNHDNYDNVKKSLFWEDYEWNDMIRPYYEFHIYLSQLVKTHFNTHGSHKFFNFEN